MSDEAAADGHPSAPARAVVFAYHDVGVRCLRVLHAHGVEIPLVVTHRDDPAEARWFASVRDTADELGLRWIAPDDANAPDVVERIRTLAPHFLFSFYFRQLLGAPLLGLASRGAYNMHGSLLPKYRGRAPVNWAVLHGERHTGVTLHAMAAKPDAGEIVAQQRVPILPDDTAREVFAKITVAAEICLDDVLPALLAGTVTLRANDLARGSYFGARTPDDGRIDWARSAAAIHDLVRAVAPPYPGARTRVAGVPARVLRTRLLDAAVPGRSPALVANDRTLVAHCGGGGTLEVVELEIDAAIVSPAAFRERFGDAPVPLA